MTIGKPRLVDPADHLPGKASESFRRGNHIPFVAPNSGSPLRAWLLIDGFLAFIDPDTQTITRVMGSGAFWIGSNDPHTIALVDSTLVRWSFEELYGAVKKCPELGLALAAISVQDAEELARWVGVMATGKSTERVARFLLSLVPWGARNPDGSRSLADPHHTRVPLTHDMIGQAIGSPREFVTVQMNRLRKKGAISYTSRELRLYPEKLEAYVQGEFQAQGER